jgi:hypothetical protein
MHSPGVFLSLQRKVCLVPWNLIQPSHLYYLAIDMLQTILDIFHPDELESSDSDQDTPQHFPQTLTSHKGTRKSTTRTAMGHIYTMLRSDTEGATEFRNLPSPVPSGTIPHRPAWRYNPWLRSSVRIPSQIPFNECKTSKISIHRRESDILNERLPPHIIEPNQARDYFRTKGIVFS